MQIAITGSSGFIGGALVTELTRLGHRPIRVVRSGGGDRAEGERIEWDIAQGRIDAAAFEGLDAVVHLAGAPIAKRWTPAHRAEILDSRVKGTTLLAGALSGLDRPPATLLSGSAIGFYGERGDELLTEASPRGDGFLAEVCEQWEAAAEPAREAGVRVAALRTGMVLDRRGGALAKMLPLFRLGVGGRLGGGRQWWPWITLDDVLGAIVHLLSSPEVSGPVNLTAPEPVTNGGFTAALAGALRRPALLPVPAFGPRLALGRELADNLLFTSARVMPAVLCGSGYAFRHPDIVTGLAAATGRRPPGPGPA
ncbi:MAG: TIGR01777 family oxidoreductase [Acidimicrobiales bacterium]